MHQGQQAWLYIGWQVTAPCLQGSGQRAQKAFGRGLDFGARRCADGCGVACSNSVPSLRRQFGFAGGDLAQSGLCCRHLGAFKRLQKMRLLQSFKAKPFIHMTGDLFHGVHTRSKGRLLTVHEGIFANARPKSRIYTTNCNIL